MLQAFGTIVASGRSWYFNGTVLRCALVAQYSTATRAPPSANDIAAAVEEYKRQHSIARTSPVFIPTTFVIPKHATEWPQSLRGKRLGSSIKSLLSEEQREGVIKKLQKLGVSSEYGALDARVQQIIDTVKVYRKLNNIPEGDAVAIPVTFVVPENSSEWPKPLWGKGMGRLIKRAMNDERYRGYLDAFKRIGLDTSLRLPAKDQKAEQLLQAVQTYKQVHGIFGNSSVSINYSYVVPQDDSRWSPSLWGKRLGRSVWKVLKGLSFPDHAERFRAVGLTNNSIDHQARLFIQAVEHYKSVHNLSKVRRLAIPKKYVVPSDPEWPQALWGMKLGQTAHTFLYGESFPEYRPQLNALGLRKPSCVKGSLLGTWKYDAKPKYVYAVSGTKAATSDAAKAKPALRKVKRRSRLAPSVESGRS